MIKVGFLTISFVALAALASAQESISSTETEKPASFDELKTKVERLITDKAEEIKNLELMLAESEAKTLKWRKEIEEYDRYLAVQREVLQFLHERFGQVQGGGTLLVGNRRYALDEVQANMVERQAEITLTAQNRDDKERELEEWKKSLHRQKASLNRVKSQLSRAKRVLAEQQERRRRAEQELAVSNIVQQTCPQGDLLFASGTELGRLLGDIEVEIGTLEALQEMRRSSAEIDLSDIRQIK